MRKIKYVMLGVALSAQVIPLAYAMCGKEATSEKRSPEECSKDNDCFIKWANIDGSFEVVIVDNGSTDGTWAVAERLAARHPEVRAMRLAKRGRHTKP